MINLKSELINFIRFLRNPDDTMPEKPFNYQVCSNLILAGLVVMAIVMVIQAVLIILISGSGQLEEMFREGEVSGEVLPAWLLIPAAVLTAPVLEELFLRLPMRPGWKHVMVSMGSGLLLFYYFSQVALTDLYFYKGVEYNPDYLIPVLIMLIGSSAFVLFKKSLPGTRIIFPVYFYFIAVFFAVLHAMDQITGMVTFFTALAWTVIQLGSGLWFGYVRMQYGMVPAIILHACWNLVAAGIIYGLNF